MPSSWTQNIYHAVFSTKHREPLIPPDLRGRTFEYLGGALANIGCPPIEVGGMSDHVHALFVLGKTWAVSRVVEEVKKESSKWAKRHVHPEFYWQNGYGAFSVSVSNCEDVRKYIATQEEHHAGRTFPDEFRALLRLHEVEWDERYVWD